MTGPAIHLLQEEIAKEAVAQVIHLLHHLPVEVVADHQVVITHQVAAILQEAAAILQVEAIVHQEVEGKF